MFILQVHATFLDCYKAVYTKVLSVLSMKRASVTQVTLTEVDLSFQTISPIVCDPRCTYRRRGISKLDISSLRST
jgi:hypothetical protein